MLISTQRYEMASHTVSSSSSPRFEASSSDSSVPTWEEFLTNTAPGPLEFPGPSYPIAGYDESRTSSQSVAAGRGAQQISPLSSDYPSGPSSSYPDIQQTTYSGPEHQAPATPSTGSYPVMATPPALHPPTMSLARPEMKLVTMRATPTPDLPSGTQVGRWTKREHELFLEGLQRFGKSWKKISSLVHTRTLVQIRTHAQKYLQKQSRAALKADAKAAAAAACASQAKPMKQEHQQLVDDIKTEPRYPALPGPSDPPTAQMSSSKMPNCPPDQWKAPGPTSRGYAPLVYPSGAMALSVTRTSTQIMTTTSIASPRSTFQLNTISRLDQLLQEDMNGNIPAFVDEYYTSPTAIEDDLLRPLYTGEPQWVPRLDGYASKRRRLERSSTAATTSTSTTGPALPSKLFEPLPVPSNLSSPVSSPKAQQVSAVASLLAAHEATDTTNYPSQWL